MPEFRCNPTQAGEEIKRHVFTHNPTKPWGVTTTTVQEAQVILAGQNSVELLHSPYTPPVESGL